MLHLHPQYATRKNFQAIWEQFFHSVATKKFDNNFFENLLQTHNLNNTHSRDIQGWQHHILFTATLSEFWNIYFPQVLITFGEPLLANEALLVKLPMLRKMLCQSNHLVSLPSQFAKIRTMAEFDQLDLKPYKSQVTKLRKILGKWYTNTLAELASNPVHQSKWSKIIVYFDSILVNLHLNIALPAQAMSTQLQLQNQNAFQPPQQSTPIATDAATANV